MTDIKFLYIVLKWRFHITKMTIINRVALIDLWPIGLKMNWLLLMRTTLKFERIFCHSINIILQMIKYCWVRTIFWVNLISKQRRFNNGIICECTVGVAFSAPISTASKGSLQIQQITCLQNKIQYMMMMGILTSLLTQLHFVLGLFARLLFIDICLFHSTNWWINSWKLPKWQHSIQIHKIEVIW